MSACSALIPHSPIIIFHHSPGSQLSFGEMCALKFLISILMLCTTHGQAFPSSCQRCSRAEGIPFPDLDLVEPLDSRASLLTKLPTTLQPRVSMPMPPNNVAMTNRTAPNPSILAPITLPPVPQGYQANLPMLISEGPAPSGIAEIGRQGVDGITVNTKDEREVRVSNVINQAVVFIYIGTTNRYVIGVRFALDNPRPIQRAIEMAKIVNDIKHVSIWFPVFPDIMNTYVDKFTDALSSALNSPENLFPYFYPGQRLQLPLGLVKTYDFTANLVDLRVLVTDHPVTFLKR